MSIQNAIDILSRIYNIEAYEIESFLESNKRNTSYSNDNNNSNIDDIIIPFCGKINENCCKAVIFNHGLYTQCIKNTKNQYCGKCSKLKYGDIYDRAKFKINEFKTSDGKKEVNYIAFVKKMNYSHDDVVCLLNRYNLYHPILDIKKQVNNSKNKESNEIKRGRGRPKKALSLDESDNLDDTIEVQEITIDNKLYYLTQEKVLLYVDSQVVAGIYKDGKIERIK